MGLDLIQSGLGGGILFLVGMIVVVLMDLLDGRRHLSPFAEVLVNPFKASHRTQGKPGWISREGLTVPCGLCEGDGIVERVV
jgi:hypothetical protein